MKIAFSTLACPGWTLSEAVHAATALGYLGLEMRSFHEQPGVERATIASDPLGLGAGEIDRLFDDSGLVPLSIATSVKYDKAINPPVLGRIFMNEEAGVEETKSYVDLADRAGIKYVRVFGHHLPAAEPRTWSMRRVSERLGLAAQTCRNTDVRLLIENSGSFSRSVELLELIERVGSQWLGASFNLLASHESDEDPVAALASVGEHLRVVKLGDIDEDGDPTRLGEGVLPVRQAVSALRDLRYTGWIVYEFPKLWKPELALSAEDVLKHAADTLYEWIQAPAASF